MKETDVWNKVFRPPCYYLQFDGRNPKCFYCEWHVPCAEDWRMCNWRLIRWLQRIQKNPVGRISKDECL